MYIMSIMRVVKRVGSFILICFMVRIADDGTTENRLSGGA